MKVISVVKFFNLLKDSGTFFRGELDFGGRSICFSMGEMYVSNNPITEEMWEKRTLESLEYLTKFSKKWGKPWWKRILCLG